MIRHLVVMVMVIVTVMVIAMANSDDDEYAVSDTQVGDIIKGIVGPGSFRRRHSVGGFAILYKSKQTFNINSITATNASSYPVDFGRVRTLCGAIGSFCQPSRVHEFERGDIARK